VWTSCMCGPGTKPADTLRVMRFPPEVLSLNSMFGI
jgi:hypothetical protein